MTSLKPYPRYKPSGAEWLGDVPDHWEAPRLKRLTKINPSRMDVASFPDDLPVTFLPMEKVSETGRVDRSHSRPIQDVRNGFTYFKDGDVIVAKITPCFENGKAALIDDLENGVGFGSTEFHVFRPHGRIDRRYLYQVVHSYDFRTLGEASMEGAGGQKRIPTDFVANFITPLPPLDEQRAIANFLDGMDARITRFIAARRKMIALLEEKKQAVINQAVTRGLDPSVPMKDSGVDWLGEIPRHWEARKVGALTTLIQTGPFGSQLPASEYVDGGVSLINPSHIAAGKLIPDPKIAVSEATAERMNRHQFRIGDIVLARRGEMGRCAVVRSENAGWLCGTGSLLVRPNENMVSPEYLQRVLSHKSLAEWLELTSAGATMSNLNTTMVASIGAPLPPIKEQETIIEKIDCETSLIDALTIRHQREIELMQEYRTRLISDVVTGKLDVRGVELPAVEEVIGAEIEAAMEDEPVEDIVEVE